MRTDLTVEELLLDESFIDYCHNQQSAHREKWESLAADNPSLKNNIIEARQLLLMVSPALSTGEINTEIDKLRSQIARRAHLQTGDATVSERLYVNERGRLRRRRIRAVLAAGVLSLVTGFILFKLPGGTQKTAVATHYRSDYAERKRVELADGSVVILNANSEITVSADYNDERRDVELKGKAFFIVARDADKPFVVRTKKFSTTALGTSFYVETSENTPAYSVELLEGKVRLESGNGKESLLEPGQQGSWHDGEKRFLKRDFDTGFLENWLNNKISFDNINVQSAFETLERWYNVTIDDRRLKRKDASIKGNYTNAKIEDIIKIICFATSSTYTISQNTITIH